MDMMINFLSRIIYCVVVVDSKKTKNDLHHPASFVALVLLLVVEDYSAKVLQVPPTSIRLAAVQIVNRYRIK